MYRKIDNSKVESISFVTQCTTGLLVCSQSMFNKISKYDTEVDNSVESLVSSWPDIQNGHKDRTVHS
jgi:hypothetical protein